MRVDGFDVFVDLPPLTQQDIEASLREYCTRPHPIVYTDFEFRLTKAVGYLREVEKVENQLRGSVWILDTPLGLELKKMDADQMRSMLHLSPSFLGEKLVGVVLRP